jgi:hypothetical protein
LKKTAFIVLCAAVGVVAGCGSKPVTVGAHRLGETVAQFNAVEKSTGARQDTEDVFTGTIHCFDDKTLGNHCQGSRLIDGQDTFDNAHYTFVGGRLTIVEFVGSGGLIGEPSENINWNLYLKWLTKRHGRATQMTPTTATWMKGESVIYAISNQAQYLSRTGQTTQSTFFSSRRKPMTSGNDEQSERFARHLCSRG